MARLIGKSLKRASTVLCALTSIATVVAFRHAHAVGNRAKPIAASQSSELSKGHAPVLNIKSIVQHGHIVEIRADTEPGTTVMINGEKAAVIFDGSGVRHFVGPLPDGITDITITVQNDEGGVNTKQLAVVMP